MKQPPDYTLPLPDEFNIKDLQKFLKKPSKVEIPDGPLKKNQVAQLLTMSLLNDLVSKRYNLRLKKDEDLKSHSIEVYYPDYSALSNHEKKNFIQQGHQLERDNQLHKKSNIVFIKKLETMKLYKKKWISIFSLMADGNTLADKIQNLILKNSADQKDTIDNYKEVIDPYIEFVEKDKKCSETGYYVNDIWRYFRHTWSLEYKTLPGRSIRILIRDKSLEYHPVIGIAALGSSVAQQTVRDEMLGWSQNNLKGQIEVEEKWYQKTINRLIGSVKYSDLLNKSIKVQPRDSNSKILVRIKEEEIAKPTLETIKSFELLSAHFLDMHHAGKNKSNKVKGDDFNSSKYWGSNQNYLYLNPKDVGH